MSNVLDSLPTASNFTDNLPSASDQSRALSHNRNIARRRFRQVLTARLLVLLMFLEEARKVSPEGPLDQYRGHWLFFQLRPTDVVNRDIFNHLTSILNKASDEYLGVSGPGEASTLSSNIYDDYLPLSPLYFVLDEAQRPARLFKEAYRSAVDTSMERPILREIVSAWDIPGYTIVSGTGLSIKEVQEAVQSQVVKPDVPWRTRTKTGAFDSRQAQSCYISRYLPPHLVHSDSGQALLRRSWSWLHGRFVSEICLWLIETKYRSRHRFTATFLDILVADSFRSPHKLLDEYISHLTSIKPSDTPECAGSEPELDEETIAKIRDLPFVDLTKITKGVLSDALGFRVACITTFI